MLDLDDTERLSLPLYKVKIGGKEYEYDALILAHKLRMLEGVEDPEKILEVVRDVLQLDKAAKLTTFDGCVILQDFNTFHDEHLEEPLKKAFGRSLFSTTTTDSNPETSTSEE